MHAATQSSRGICPARLAQTRAFRVFSRRAGAVASRARRSVAPSASSKPTLYDVPVSNNGARVRLLLYWKGLERDFRIENPSVLGGLKSEAYLELNPQGKMPLLVVPSPVPGGDGDAPMDAPFMMALPESEVIAQYVLHKYEHVGPLLIPEDPDQRALASLITRVHDVYIAPVQGCMYRGPMPVEKRAEDLQTVKKQMDVVERVFADAARTRRPQSQSLKSGNDVHDDGPFVCGSQPCFADAALFPTYVFLERILPRYFGWDDVFAERPRTKKWFHAMCADAGGERVLGEIRAGLDDWHDAGRWETTGVLEAVKDDRFTWKY
jgi:glutathione S-transferase